MSVETTLTKDLIRAMAADLGFDDIGFAQATNGTPHDSAFKEAITAGRMGPLDYMVRTVEERSDVYQLMPDAKTVIVVVKNYFTGNYGEDLSLPADDQAKVSRYAWGKDYHQWMRKKLRRFRKDILAYQSHQPQAQARIFNDTSPVLERAWAEKAGLGFIGKSTMFIHRKMGTWTFLGGLVLNWDVEPDPPMISQFCGTCTRCMDACPTQAFLAPGSLDANRCLTTWSIERPLSEAAQTAPGEGSGWGFGCDVCQEVCPWNKFEQVTDEPRFQPLKGHQFLDAELSELPEALEGTAFARARREGVRRSTLRALKKTGAPDLESE